MCTRYCKIKLSKCLKALKQTTYTSLICLHLQYATTSWLISTADSLCSITYLACPLLPPTTHLRHGNSNTITSTTLSKKCSINKHQPGSKVARLSKKCSVDKHQPGSKVARLSKKCSVDKHQPGSKVARLHENPIGALPL